jgi:hypothetical protein
MNPEQIQQFIENLKIANTPKKVLRVINNNDNDDDLDEDYEDYKRPSVNYVRRNAVNSYDSDSDSDEFTSGNSTNSDSNSDSEYTSGNLSTFGDISREASIESESTLNSDLDTSEMDVASQEAYDNKKNVSLESKKEMLKNVFNKDLSDNDIKMIESFVGSMNLH